MENNQAVVRPSEEKSLKSRFGYHVCDYDTFREIKALHKIFWEQVRKFAAFERWDRKTINQFGQMPKYFRLFQVPKTWKKYDSPRVLRTGENKHGRMTRDTENFWIRKLFLLAKTPHAAPVEPLSDEVLSKIAGTMASYEKWDSEES